MISLLGVIFNQSEIISLTSKYLKTTRDTYGINLGENPKYE